MVLFYCILVALVGTFPTLKKAPMEQNNYENPIDFLHGLLWQLKIGQNKTFTFFLIDKAT